MSYRTFQHILLFVLLLLVSCPFTEAQNTRWDHVLDEYEQICDDCIHLRKRIENKESVSSSSVTKLLGRLSDLRNTLQNASGTMTQEQRTRFEDIRNRYARAMGEKIQPSASKTESLQAKTQQKEPTSRQKHKQEQEEIIQAKADTLFLLVQEDLTHPMEIILERGRQETPSHLESVMPLSQDTGLPAQTKTSYRIMGLARRQHQRRFEYGLMLNIMKGRWGGFMMVSSNLSIPKSSQYVVTQGGGIPSGGYFKSGGEMHYSAFHLSVGAVRNLWNFLDVYAGAGYGLKRLQWIDQDGQWANVEGYDHGHVTLDAGLIASWKSFSMMIGASLENGGWDYSLGVGVNF